MEIRWYGKNAFAIKEGKLRVVIDPYENLAKELTEDDVVLTTKGSVENYSGKVYDWPGEFETKGVLVHSIAVSLGKDEERVLSFEVEGIRIANLSGIIEELSDDMISELGNVDILILPMTLKAKQCVEMVEEIDPRMVIVSMQDSENANLLGDFLKEVGQTELQEEDKVVIKSRNSLDGENATYKVLTRT
jgi:hypothetical protein